MQWLQKKGHPNIPLDWPKIMKNINRMDLVGG